MSFCESIMIAVEKELPIDPVLPGLRRALARSEAAVLQAPPGAGKTTRVAPAFLDAPWLAGKSILMLEPRRLAATNAARYMSRLLGERVGGTVGYAIRYERRVSSATRIEIVTEGILTRRLQSDPTLEGVGLVIFDEFHERNLNSDLALALCRDAQKGLREDLKILVMSATLDGEAIAGLLGDAPLLASEGRAHPVQIRYLERDPHGPAAGTAAAGIRRALRRSEGDILAFLPGVGEIRRCRELLSDLDGEVDLRPLYGDLPFAEQEKAILPGTRRRVVLATNIAETSLTIEGVAVVVDSGLERRPRFDPGRGMTILETTRISAASAEQRAGRAGRLGPGICYRLWSEGTHGALLPFAPPEIRSADLAPLALDLARWGVTDPGELTWLDPPPAGHLAGARDLLRLLGALDKKGRVTALGRQMGDYPAHPRLARLLVAARKEGLGGLGADLAALLSERSPHFSDSDLVERLELLRHREAGPAGRAARYWRRKVGHGGGESTDAFAVARLLAVAFPDRIGRQRDPGSRSYRLSSGQGARLSPRSALAKPPWLVAVEMTGRAGGEAEIRLANALEPADIEDLFGRDIDWEKEVGWDERSGRVFGREVRRLGAVTLQERPAGIRPEDAAAALAGVIRRQGLDILDWRPAVRQWRARVRLLARVCPGAGWPDLADPALLDHLEDWLVPFLTGITTLARLRKTDPLPALQSLLDWEHQRRLERLAPERIEVPGGSRIRLDYEAQDGPVLAVKLQELFGLAETPRLADGKVPVLIHLLSPASRPLAVTRDLNSFWNEVYPEVKKEMKGRYPRHPWPDDPWSAPATGKTKKRR